MIDIVIDNNLGVVIRDYFDDLIQKTRLSLSKDGSIRSLFEEGVELLIKQSPEYESLLAGELDQLFHLGDHVSTLTVLEQVIERIKGSITQTVSANSAVISLLNTDYSDLLSIDGTSYEFNGESVTWLDWILTGGDTVVLPPFLIDVNRFRIPPVFSGTDNNNWLTRSLDQLETFVRNNIAVVVQQRLQSNA